MGPRAGAVPAGLVLLALLLFFAQPAEAQSGEVTNVQLSIYNRTSIDVSWANTDQNVKHYIRWSREYRDVTRRILTTAWENPEGSDGVERGAGVRTYRISGLASNMYQVQIRRDGGQWTTYRAYVPAANDRTDPPFSVNVTPGDGRLQVSWLPSRGPTPTRYSIDWEWTHEGAFRNPRDSEAEVEGREIGTNVRHRYTITGIPNGATATVTVSAILSDWGEDYESRGVRATGSPREAAAKSSDATLSDIILFGVGRTYAYTPDFDSDTTQYAATVPRNVDHVIVIPYVNEVNATYVVEGAVGSGHATLHSEAVVLAAPTVAKGIDIVVTAHDGMTTKTYTVTVTRQGSTDATLKALTVSDGTNDVPLTPAFDSDTVSYTASVAHGVSSVTVTPTVHESHATVAVDGTTVNSGTASSAVSLTAGEANDILVVVTAEDTSVTKTYTVSVTRAGSSDATLSGLTTSDGTLTPAFDSSKTAYTATVAYSVASVTVTPTVNESNATVAVNGSGVTSGSPSQAISLTAGQSTNLNVVVTAQDGVTTKAYTIAVTRSPPTFSIAATASAAEGESASLIITLSHNAPMGGVAFSVTAQYSTTGTGNAVAADVGTITTPVTVAENTSTKNISIPTAEDSLDEDAETFKVVIATSVSPWVKAGDGKDTATITINDDDTAGFTVTPTTLKVNEGASKTYTIVLDTKPTANVAVSLTNPDTGAVTVAPTSWTFTTSNWNTAKTFTVSGVEDSDYADETVTISHSVTSADSRYSGLTPDSVTVNVDDNNVRAVTVAFGSATYTVKETDDTTTTVVKENEATVTIPITKTNQGGASDSDYSGVPTSVTFNSGETSKSFTFSATADTIDDDGESVKLTFGALPTGVSAGSTDETTVSINDDDLPADVDVAFEQSWYIVTEGSDVTVTVKLSVAPERSITIPITKSSQDGATSADYSGVPASLTFGATNTEKSFTFSATSDNVDDDGESVTLGFGTFPTGVTAGSPSTASVTIRQQSAYLSALTASVATSETGTYSGLTLAPAFDRETRAYSVRVDPDITHAKVTPTVEDTNATVQVGKRGTTLATVASGSASGSIPLERGVNEIIVLVTEASSNPSTYTVTINVDGRPPAPAGLLVKPGPHSLQLTWAAPGVTVDGYDVRYTTMSADDLADDAKMGYYQHPRTGRIVNRFPYLGWVDIGHSHRESKAGLGYFNPGQEYRVRVRAYNSYGIGPWAVGIGTPLEATYTVSLSASAERVREGDPVTITATVMYGDRPTVIQKDMDILLSTHLGTAEAGDVGTLERISIGKYTDRGSATIQTHRDSDNDDEKFAVLIHSIPTRDLARVGDPYIVWVTITEGDPAPPEPVILVPELRASGGDGALHLSWSDSSSEHDGYDVEYRRSATETTAATAWADAGHTGTKRSMTITGLTNGVAYDARVRLTFPNDTGRWSEVASATLEAAVELGNPRRVTVTISDTTAEEGETVTLTATLDEPAPREGATVQFWAYGNTIGGTATPATVWDDYRLSPPDPGVESWHSGVGRTVTSINRFTTRAITIGPGRTTATAELEVVLNQWTGRQGSCPGTTRPLAPRCPWIYAPIAESAEGIGVYATAKVPDRDHKHGRRALTSPTVTMTIYDIGQSPTVSGNAPPEQESVAQPTSVTLSLDAATVGESAGTATLTATLDAPAPAVGIGVFLTADGSTATEDVDFSMPLGIFVAGGERFATAAVTITDDDLDEADETVALPALFDLGTAFLEDIITLTITDDDTAGVTVAAANPLSVDEGATATYTVVLDSQPTADVTITATSGDSGAASVSPASHTFTSSTWITPVTFTVSGVTDSDTNDETVAVSHSATSEDPKYSSVVVSAVTVSVSDTTQEQQKEQANRPPTVASAIADATIVQESGTQTVSLSGVFADADNDALTVMAASLNVSVAMVSVAADYSSLMLTARSRGTATITVTAADGVGGTVSRTPSR